MQRAVWVYRFLERTTLLVMSECLSISHIIAMQLLYHGLPPFKQDYHSRKVLNNCKCDSAIASQCNFIDVFNYHDHAQMNAQ